MKAARFFSLKDLHLSSLDPWPFRFADGGVKVLLVEDDGKLSGLVRKGLEARGFVVDQCDNGDDGLLLATTRVYDALVLDIMVPGRDGLSILRQLRESRATVPVILVTARSALNERLDGLGLGADDYLTKPFYVEELAARLQAVLRRTIGAPAGVLAAGDLSVNLLTREVRRAGVVVELTAREFALLAYLLRSPGRTFTRAQICEQVWNYHFDPGTNLVDVYVQHLRKKLGDTDQTLIDTVRGVGYRICAESAPSASG